MTKYIGKPNTGFWDDFQKLQYEMDRFFSSSRSTSDQFPLVNVWADSERCELTAELPGVASNDVDIQVKGNNVTIEGLRNTPDIDENASIHRQERGYGRFIRSLPLPYEIEVSHVKAVLKNGVLTVQLPRAEASKPKKISIDSE